MLVPELNGTEGQKVLQGSSVLVVGAGGIGVTAIMYLAGAGVGKIGIVDFDIVDVSNLHRQIIYTMDQVGTKKSECAAQRARALNPSITIEAIDAKVNCSNAIELISPYDVIVDATDNFQVRYVLNDACVLERKPLVSGAAGKYSPKSEYPRYST
jgi:adenylyltransferase/sulfurtransferase